MAMHSNAPSCIEKVFHGDSSFVLQTKLGTQIGTSTSEAVVLQAVAYM
jgi:hypothetical protein